MVSQAQRQRMLVEMGYQPLRWRGRAPTRPVVEPAATSAPGPTAHASTDAARAPAKRGALSDPLWQALLQAVGAAHLDPGTLGWEERLDGPAFDFDGPILRINPIALRQRPDAKRALWKTLRALRRRLAAQGLRAG